MRRRRPLILSALAVLGLLAFPHPAALARDDPPPAVYIPPAVEARFRETEANLADLTRQVSLLAKQVADTNARLDAVLAADAAKAAEAAAARDQLRAAVDRIRPAPDAAPAAPAFAAPYPLAAGPVLRANSCTPEARARGECGGTAVEWVPQTRYANAREGWYPGKNLGRRK